MFTTTISSSNKYADQLQPASQVISKYFNKTIFDSANYNFSFQFIDDVFFQNEISTYLKNLEDWASKAEKGASIFTYQPEKKEWQLIIKNVSANSIARPS